MRLKRTILLAAVCLASLAACKKEGGTAAVGDVSRFPSKPITILAHTEAGSSTDIFARELARAAQPLFGQPVVVVNRPGGGGATQMAELQSSKPDGYTLGVNTSSQLTAMQTNLKGVYTMKDFSWIALNQLDPYVVVVKSDSPYKTLKDLMDAGVTGGKHLKVGGYGETGSAHNIAFNLLADKAGLKFTWVPYPGGQQGMTALLGDHLDVVNTNPGPVLQFAEAGRVRVLGVLAKERLKAFPDVPTFAEAGYPVDDSWVQIRGIYGPAGMSADLQKKIADTLFKAMQAPEFQKYMDMTAQIAGDKGPDAYPGFIEKQDQTTRQWLAKLGIGQ